MIIWYKFWSRDYTIHYIESCLRVMISNDKNPHPFKNILFIKNDGLYSLYADANEKDILQKKIKEMYASSPQRLKKFIEEFTSFSECF